MHVKKCYVRNLIVGVYIKKYYNMRQKETDIYLLCHFPALQCNK